HSDYPERFRKAFGIGKAGEITKELAAKAISQFERTMISGNSRYDQKRYQLDPDPFLFSELEAEGYQIYFDANGATANAGHCAHCHDGGPLLTSDGYFNNAITQVNSLDDFVDKGLGGVTGVRADNGKFRAPSLRNITLSAPYMHDGRFQTLEQVIDHYNSGGHYADNVQVASIMPLYLTDDQKKALRAFLDTFTDTSFVNNPALQNPFQ
ncbi:MAG: cytochrome c peroxidase, partial [Bacteroidota bacterium]